MRRTTKKLSGTAKDRYLRQWLATEPGLDRDAIERLAKRGAEAISSLRVRKLRWSSLKPGATVLRAPASTAVPEPALAPSATSSPPKAAGSPIAAKAADPVASQQPSQLSDPSVRPPAPPASAPFDPYLVALVPVLQREGAVGLIARLTAIGDADKLRQMARAQQIALPAEVRTGPIAIPELASAIADAVAKRIADRKAAAR